MSNPYLAVHARIRRQQGGSVGWILPLVAAAVATPLARPVLLGFLDRGDVSGGVEAIGFRLAALVVAALSLHTYTDLVRGRDRPVLDPHPVHAGQLLTAIAVRTARERLYLPLMGAVLLSPIALAGHVDAWLGSVALLVAAYVCGLGLGFTVHLGAVWVAMSPGLAGMLDLLRGSNPRMQAALIYAPGVVLAVGGAAVGFAAVGLGAALQGWTPGWFWLAAPAVVGVLSWAGAGRLADRYYVRATSLLAEVDAEWGQVDEGDEARRVYLEWIAGERPELLRALRQGWRRLRAWPMGAWGMGVVGAFAGWNAAPGAPAQVVAVAGAAVLLMGAVSVRMAAGDPEWLDRALGVETAPVARARGTAALLYAQGAILPPVAALLVRQGTAALAPLLVVETLAVLGAVLGAAAAARWRGRGLWIYGPSALLIWAATARLALDLGVPHG